MWHYCGDIRVDPVQRDPMAKELVFKMRLDTQDRARLDRISAHYSAPAATVVRMLIKREDDRQQLGQQSGPRPFTMEDEHLALLRAFPSNGNPASLIDLSLTA